MASEEVGGGLHGAVFSSVLLVGEVEPPASGPFGDRRLVVILEFDGSRRKDPTVIGPARPGPMTIDRTAVPDEHRTTTVLVISEQHVAGGETRSGEEQRARN